MYTGEIIRHSIMGGHIPGAVNIVSLDGTDGSTGKWRDQQTLTTLYAQLPNDKRIDVYCHDGFRMGLAYLQLKHLGFDDVRLDNGGWSHWGNTLTLPVVEGDEPLGDDFALLLALTLCHHGFLELFRIPLPSLSRIADTGEGAGAGGRGREVSDER